MALDVEVVEEPGSGYPVYQCPHCSRGYPTIGADGSEMDVPGNCKRCGAPMDWEKVHGDNGFAEQKAQGVEENPNRRDRMVRRRRNKGGTTA